MAFYDYSIAVGHNNAAGLVNVEDFFRNVAGSMNRAFPPVGDPVPTGSVRRIALDQSVVDNGTKIIRWTWSVLPKAEFNAFITTYLGSFDTASAKVTIRTRTRQDTFANYNATLLLPRVGEDYQRGGHGRVLQLSMTLRNLVAL